MTMAFLLFSLYWKYLLHCLELLYCFLFAKNLIVWVKVASHDHPAVSLELTASATFKQLIEKAKETYRVNELHVECAGEQPELDDLVVDVMRVKNAGHHELRPFRILR